MVRYTQYRVRKTLPHGGSEANEQHVYVRMPQEKRNELNRIIGGFKHFGGPRMTISYIFIRYGLPAMEQALKELIAAKRAQAFIDAHKGNGGVQ